MVDNIRMDYARVKSQGIVGLSTNGHVGKSRKGGKEDGVK
jgi:hypothetical protein